MARTAGIVCLAVCGVCIVWGMFGLAYTAAGGPNEYRFDGVRAAEGTTLTVRNDSNCWTDRAFRSTPRFAALLVKFSGDCAS